MTERYFILLYNKIDMKMKMPKISSKINYQIIVVFILLVVVVFITAMPWASNTFHEALENISNTPDGSMSEAVKAGYEVTWTGTKMIMIEDGKKLPVEVVH
jgi:hypothetical protein